MRKVSRSFLAVLLFSLIWVLSQNVVFAQTTIIQDNLQGSTQGTMVGGSFSGEGYKPGLDNSGKNHIVYTSPQQISSGYMEVQFKGFHTDDIPNDGDHQGFFTFFDGRGLASIPGWDEFQRNYFRYHVSYRKGGTFKGIMSCAAPTPARINSGYAVFGDENGDGTIDHRTDSDWFTENSGSSFYFDRSTWYTLRIEWINRQFKAYLNGTLIWEPAIAEVYDYNPVNFKIWIGSAAVNGTVRYTNKSADIVYRNFLLVSYAGGPPPSGVAPNITSSPVLNGTVGQLYQYDVNATGNPTPGYKLITSPSGMTINGTTGLIQWTPGSTGNFNVTVEADNDVSPNASQSFTINVTNGGPPPAGTAPVITSAAVLSGTVGQLYQYDVNATGNPTPDYALLTFPSGMTINPTTGLIQWTPSSTGNFNVTVEADNNVFPNATQSFTIAVTSGGPPPPSNAPLFTSTPGTSAVVGQLFSYDANATGNPAPEFSLLTWIPGMTINPTTGLIQWTPGSTGNFEVRVKAANGVSPDAKQYFTIVVTAGGPPPSGNAPVITSTPVLNGTVGQLYQYDVNATGNPTPDYTLLTFPSGMTINPTTGLIQWTPSSTGNFNVTVEADNNVSPNATQSFTIVVTSGGPPPVPGAPLFTSAPVTNGVVGQLYSYDANATGNPAPEFSLLSWIPGMTINPTTGLIQWTPGSTGNFEVRVKAANGVSPDAKQIFTIVVTTGGPPPPGPSNAPLFTSTPGTSAVVGQLFSYDANATGNPAPEFSLVTLPWGMTINAATGLIQWTPSSTGNFNVGVKAANGISPDAKQYFTIVVNSSVQSTAPSISPGALNSANSSSPVLNKTGAEVLPLEYALYQNYPNPFNPSTKIKFAVPMDSKVSLQIYNQLGEVVAQPVNNFYTAGNYEIEVNMSNLATGVYFYKISAGDFSAVKKMMLVK
jgi:hypothetical protein